MPEVPKNVLHDGPVVEGGDVLGQVPPPVHDASQSPGDVPGEGVRPPVRGGGASAHVVGYAELTAEDAEALAELKDAIKAAIPTQNDYLSKLLTLNTALVGGGLVLAKGEVLPHWWAVGTLVLLFLSAVTCLYGLAPTRAVVSYSPEGAWAFQDAQEQAIGKKRWATQWAARLFALALAVGICGMVAKGCDQPPKYIPTAK